MTMKNLFMDCCEDGGGNEACNVPVEELGGYAANVDYKEEVK